MRVHVLVALAPFAWPFSRRRSRRGCLRPNIGQGLSSARGPECGGDFFRGSIARKHHRRRRHPASPSSIPHAAPVTGREGGGLDVDDCGRECYPPIVESRYLWIPRSQSTSSAFLLQESIFLDVV